MHGRHYAGETARRLIIKHATLSRPHAGAARLSARLFGTRAAAAFVNGWRRLGVVLSGLSFLGFGYCLMG